VSWADDFLVEKGVRESNPVGRGRYMPGRSFGGTARPNASAVAAAGHPACVHFQHPSDRPSLRRPTMSAGARLFLHYGELVDGSRVAVLLSTIRPHEVCHLAAQSHVKVNFDEPEYIAETTRLGQER
jgi:hypothetical protein